MGEGAAVHVFVLVDAWGDWAVLSLIIVSVCLVLFEKVVLLLLLLSYEVLLLLIHVWVPNSVVVHHVLVVVVGLSDVVGLHLLVQVVV